MLGKNHMEYENEVYINWKLKFNVWLKLHFRQKSKDSKTDVKRLHKKEHRQKY